MFLKLLITSFIITITSANNKCSIESPTIVPKYNLIERCHRSTLGIAAKANFTSLISCQRLGIQKKALALNFSPEMSSKDGDEPLEPLEYTCEVLKCAEAAGGLSLTNDTRYDYYSIYGKPLPSVNSTCVPASGMFFLLPKRRNYTQAEARCKAISGVLADVSSEQRTDALSQVLASAGVDAAYVAMWSRNDSVFYTNSDSLDCTTYRAWAPGYPRRSPNMTCVVLTRFHTWKTSPCKAKFQALCELIPGGPYKKGSIFDISIKAAKWDSSSIN
ncbi:uncharacterized protein LOC123866605 [Maniola jurtina]|uniref:uncharacterized protein LOC123866605 n=1 Tax=Maniola jurtina TaxID=191418 RepID=UPI001E68E286|nr:uncharacterized protein LOC123866605 [Maniola jurtina]